MISNDDNTKYIIFLFVWPSVIYTSLSSPWRIHRQFYQHISVVDWFFILNIGNFFKQISHFNIGLIVVSFLIIQRVLSFVYPIKNRCFIGKNCFKLQFQYQGLLKYKFIKSLCKTTCFRKHYNVPPRWKGEGLVRLRWAENMKIYIVFLTPIKGGCYTSLSIFDLSSKYKDTCLRGRSMKNMSTQIYSYMYGGT